jgi:octaprenyl-diphosphate synthase
VATGFALPRDASSLRDLRAIVDLVGDDLARVEDLFEEQLHCDVRLIGEIGRYVKDGGGKRIRPALLLLAARMCGGEGSRAVLLATVVEFIHTATLLHDDIIDGAVLRRGRRSANSRWGNDATVLLGDFLYAKSMSMALTQENLPILRLLSDVTIRMIEGEILEIERRAQADVTEDQHLDLMRRKTAHLFSACARIGAMLGAKGAASEEALAGYGLDLGVAFQMVDDLLDFTGDEDRLGKPVLSDLRDGKVTLPAVYLMRRGGGEARRLVGHVLEDRGFDRVQPKEIVALARECGALEEARARAEGFARRAQEHLAGFDASPFRDALSRVPDFILAREI